MMISGSKTRSVTSGLRLRNKRHIWKPRMVTKRLQCGIFGLENAKRNVTKCLKL